METELQPERVLVNRLRMAAWMSGTELDDRAGLPQWTTHRFETETHELGPGERRKLVAMLGVLLTARRDYVDALKRWRAATKMDRRQASFVIGCQKQQLAKMERGEFRKWPHWRVRNELDRVLTEWERTLPPVQSCRFVVMTGSEGRSWTLFQRGRLDALGGHPPEQSCEAYRAGYRSVTHDREIARAS